MYEQTREIQNIDPDAVLAQVEAEIAKIEEENIRSKKANRDTAMMRIETNRAKQSEKQAKLNKCKEAQEKLKELKSSDIFVQLSEESRAKLQSLTDQIPVLIEEVEQLEDENQKSFKAEGVEEGRQDEAIRMNYKRDQQEALNDAVPQLAQLIQQFEAWGVESEKAEEDLKIKDRAMEQAADEFVRAVIDTNWQRQEKLDVKLSNLLREYNKASFITDRLDKGKEFVEKLEEIKGGYLPLTHNNEKKIIDGLLAKEKQFNNYDGLVKDYQVAKAVNANTQDRFKIIITGRYKDVLDNARDQEKILSTRYAENFKFNPPSLSIKVKDKLILLIERQLDVTRREENGEQVSGRYYDLRSVKEEGGKDEKRLLRVFEKFNKATEGWEQQKPEEKKV